MMLAGPMFDQRSQMPSRPVAGVGVEAVHRELFVQLGQHPVALVEVLEGLRDVSLDLLELQTDPLDAVERRRVGDLADRGCRGLHRVSRGPPGLREVGQGVLHATGGKVPIPGATAGTPSDGDAA